MQVQVCWLSPQEGLPYESPTVQPTGRPFVTGVVGCPNKPGRSPQVSAPSGSTGHSVPGGQSAPAVGSQTNVTGYVFLESESQARDGNRKTMAAPKASRVFMDWKYTANAASGLRRR